MIECHSTKLRSFRDVIKGQFINVLIYLLFEIQEIFQNLLTDFMHVHLFILTLYGNISFISN